MVGIVYFGAGNLFSLTAVLDRMEVQYEIITDANFDESKYSRFIIPGVGHARTAFEKLQKTGMIEAILQIKKPVLGICVGMQLLTTFSEEGNVDLLKLFPMKTVKFDKQSFHIKVPHMGWNQVSVEKANPLFVDIPNNTYFYYVHSYYIEMNAAYTLAKSSYGNDFTAVMNKDNFFGVQFHPEKSGVFGEKLLKNFTLI